MLACRSPNWKSWRGLSVKELGEVVGDVLLPIGNAVHQGNGNAVTLDRSYLNFFMAKHRHPLGPLGNRGPLPAAGVVVAVHDKGLNALLTEGPQSGEKTKLRSHSGFIAVIDVAGNRYKVHLVRGCRYVSALSHASSDASCSRRAKSGCTSPSPLKGVSRCRSARWAKRSGLTRTPLHIASCGSRWAERC